MVFSIVLLYFHLSKLLVSFSCFCKVIVMFVTFIYMLKLKIGLPNFTAPMLSLDTWSIVMKGAVLLAVLGSIGLFLAVLGCTRLY